MTSLAPRPYDLAAEPVDGIGEPPSPLGRDPLALGRMRWADVAAITVMLLVVFLVMPTAPFTTDEGEILLQHEVLDRSGSWTVEYPALDLDPRGEWFPVYRIERDGMRFLPHIKHPAWQTSLRPLVAMFGVQALTMVHLVALIATAGAAAMLARRLGSQRERAVFWAVGALSPLTVGVFIGLGHTVGAFAVTVGFLALARPAAGPTTSGLAAGSAWRAGVGAVALGAGVLVRNEVLLVACAVAVVLVWQRRWKVGAMVLACALAAYGWNYAWLHSIWGPDARPFTVVDPERGWLAGRVGGLMRATFGIDSGVVLLIVAILSVVGAWLAGAQPDHPRLVRWGCVLMVASPAVAIVFGPVAPIAGLLIVTPVLMVATRRFVRPSPRHASWFVLLAAALAAAAVVATQYSDGGGLQWGGRFFHALAPAALAVLIVLCRIPDRRTVIAVALAGALWTGVGWVSVAHLREFHGRVLDDVSAVAARSGTAAGAPVVAGDLRVLGALGWREFDQWRAMNVPTEELERLAVRLDGAGVDRWTLIWTVPSPPARIGVYQRLHARRDVTGSIWIVTMDRP